MTSSIENLSLETRSFAPPSAFAATANATADLYAAATADRLGFWEKQAEELSWSQRWSDVLDWSKAPFAQWFVGGRLNVSVNCLDRHVDAGLGDRVAYYFEGEPGDTITLTYSELLASVSQAAHALTALGLAAGDRVAIYLPMIPEAAVAMLACARLGLVHSVVFGGFSADALASRIEDTAARVIITADGGFRRGAPAALKPTVDEALPQCPTVEHVLVVKRTGSEVAWGPLDIWWHEALAAQPSTHTPEFFDAEHPLFILYTSGTTAKPKGILHTTGGYLTQTAATVRWVFDIKPATDVYWCTADIGWVTGHSYVVYGMLSNAATSVMYEGTPDSPTQDRWWKIIEKYGVTILYTAPTAIRTFMKWGDALPLACDLSSLRLLGSVGEPINPEAWMWYRTVIGGSRCPIVDTWWQTETGSIMISPLPGVTATKPGSAMQALPGIGAAVVDDAGIEVPSGSGGYLVLTEPWPSMLRGIWGDPERFVETYWSTYKDLYFAGDGAKTDPDGTVWLQGRVDDVMNVSGHRISTTEVESALVSHPSVAEAAVVGANDATTGQAIVAFVTVRGGVPSEDEAGAALARELREHVADAIGKIARPRDIILTPDLPKTRSGKIMRRLLRDVAENRPLGDVTTLADPSVVNAISSRVSSGAED